MTSADYTFLLNQPGAINDRQTESLEKIVAEFPYFQSARALRLKGLYNQNSFQYNFALKVAAAYTTDRSVLFDFITSDTFTAIHKGLYDQKLAELHDMDVDASEVIASDKPNDTPKVDLVEASILTSIKESEGRNSESNLDDVEFEKSEPSQPQQESVESEELVVTTQPAFLTEIPIADAFEEIDPSVSELAKQFVPIESIPASAEQFDSLSENKPNETVESVVAGEKSDAPIPPQAVDSELQTSQEKLHIGEPLEFSKSETHSFQEWLQLSRLQPIVRDEPNVDDEIVVDETQSEKTEELVQDGIDPKFSKTAIIDRFIETNPKIPKMKPDAGPAAIPEFKDVHSSLMTETLARVYLEQKKYQKAIQAYEILILKYPEKSSFFADRISEIKSLQQNT